MVKIRTFEARLQKEGVRTERLEEQVHRLGACVGGGDREQESDEAGVALNSI